MIFPSDDRVFPPGAKDLKRKEDFIYERIFYYHDRSLG